MNKPPHMNGGHRVAVISDIHGNGRAYASALELARAAGFDQLIILGDLLTYGVDSDQVLSLTAEALERDGAILLKGNHDQLYFDLAAGETAYFDKLPDWIKETVNWTAARVDIAGLSTRFAWREEYALGDVLFAHANPFAYGDWTYLSGPEELTQAARTLERRGYRVGVFGHTHRQGIVAVHSSGEIHVVEANPVTGVATFIVNPGSVGQPRDARKMCTFAMVTAGSAGLAIEFVDVPYDAGAFGRDISQSGMSPETCTKLLGYLR